MSYLRCISALLLIPLLAGCPGGDGDKNTEFRFKDAVGDAAFPFIDIVASNVEVTDQTIIFTIQLLNLPDQFTYDSVNIIPPVNSFGVVEYSWSVLFDLDSNGLQSGGDIQLGLISAKENGENEKTDHLKNFINGYTANTFDIDNFILLSASAIVSAQIEVYGNVIILTVNKSVNENLSTIQPDTPVIFYSMYCTDASTCYDDIVPDGIEKIMVYPPVSAP